MLLNKILVDYNPIALVFKKILQKSQLLGDIANYFRTLIGSAMPPFIEKFLFGIGVFSLTSFTIKKIYDTYKMWGWIIPHYHNIRKYNQKLFQQRYGKCWVIVTGFTEGIGWNFALQFAKLKFNLILVGRNKAKIKQRVTYLNHYYRGIKVQIIEADATIRSDVQRIKQTITKLSESKDIGIIINNLGMAVQGQFFDIDKKNLLDALIINSRFTIQMTQNILPLLKKRQKRSAIINVCSCTGIFISPWIGGYSASKSLLDIYTRTIAQQNKQKIDIMSPRPFGVTTKMMKMRKGPFMVTSQECVKSILYDFPHTVTTYGAFKHKLSGAYLTFLTETQIFEAYKLFKPKK